MKRLWRFASLSSLFLGWGLLLFLFGRYWTQAQYLESSQACLSQDLESSPTLQPVTEEDPDEVQASPAPVPQIVTQPVQTTPQINQGGADVEGQDIPPANTQETQSASEPSQESVEGDQVTTPEEPRRKRR